jgi:molybdate transport system permease protein
VSIDVTEPQVGVGTPVPATATARRGAGAGAGGARAGRALGAALMGLCIGTTLTFLALPIVALFAEVPLSSVPDLLTDPVVRHALEVTVRTNLVANVLILAFGTPLAYFLATRRFRGRALVVTLVELPLVLPPAVAGIGLLAAFGAQGLFGDDLKNAGFFLPFTEWAVVFAVTFVASPFYIRQAISSFESIDPTLVAAARTLGAGPTRTFWRISLPLAGAGLVAGWVLAFARGVGEFGATIIFAGNVQGRTQTLTLAVYEQLDANFDVAIAIGILLVVLSAGVLLSYKMILSWRDSTSPSSARFGTSSWTSS